jgi:hypothetical protein
MQFNSSRWIKIALILSLKKHDTDHAHWQTYQTYYSLHFQK